MSRREILKMERIRRGGIKCHQCGVRLNSRNLEYVPKRWPLGLVEFVPICKSCLENNGEEMR